MFCFSLRRKKVTTDFRLSVKMAKSVFQEKKRCKRSARKKTKYEKQKKNSSFIVFKYAGATPLSDSGIVR